MGIELRAEAVGFAYDGDAVLEDVSVAVGAGEWVAIVGPNGSGKSTLLRILLGQISPMLGKVVLDGRDMKGMNRREVAGKIAMVAQASATPFGYSVREMVLMARYHAHEGWGGWLPSFETADDLQTADEAMWAMDVHHLAGRAITTLSGGERQRVMIARALCQRSPIVLLDEPTSALDLHHQLELIEQMRVMAEAGRAVVWVTHDVAAARRHVKRTVVMDRGKIVADGKSEAVLTAEVLEPIYRVKVEARDGRIEFRRR